MLSGLASREPLLQSQIQTNKLHHSDIKLKTSQLNQSAIGSASKVFKRLSEQEATKTDSDCNQITESSTLFQEVA